MLDASSSMNDDNKWNNLMISYQNFVNHLEGNKDLRENSFLTVITFNDVATIVF